jgi:hypothetical protein
VIMQQSLLMPWCTHTQVWHTVFHPAGSAGLATVLAAPRYTFMHQVRRGAEPAFTFSISSRGKGRSDV